MDIQIKSMTRGQMKALKEKGLDPAFMGAEVTAQKNADMIDCILDTVYSTIDFDDIEYSECIRIAQETYIKSYGREIEKKI